MIRLVCLTASLAGLAGCGLIDSEMGEIELDLPARQVTVDTADWELTDEGQMPAVECGETPTLCKSEVETWCGADDLCSARCDGQTCEVDVAISLWHTFNLTQDAPELAPLAGESLVSVTVDRLSFTVVENTLNMTSPPLTVSIAPQGVTTTGGGAEELGTIPAVGQGETENGDVELSADAKLILADRLRDYETPFNLIVSSTVLLRAGDPVPSGRLVASIKVSAHARTGL